MHAGRYDLGPQKFYEPSTPSSQTDSKYETKEVILYLTPSQVKALEARGAVVRPQLPEAEPEAEAQTEEPEQTIENEQGEAETTEEQSRSQLEEILKILNDQIEEEDNSSEADNEPQAEEEQGEEQDEEQQEEEQDEQEEEEQEEGQEPEQDQEQEQEQQDEDEEEEEEEEEEITERPRTIPARFRPAKKQREDRYLAPSVRKQNKKAKANAAPRIPASEQSQKTKPRNQTKKTEKKKEEAKTDLEALLQKKFRLVPLDDDNISVPAITPVEEPSQEPAQGAAQEPAQETPQTLAQEVAQEEQQAETEEEIAQEKLAELLTPLLNSDKVVQSITQQRSKLLQRELQLQTALRELKEAPKHNDQKYAIELEKLKANLEKQNALARAEVLAKTNPLLVKEELRAKKRRPVSAKLVNVSTLTKLRSSEAAQKKGAKPFVIPLQFTKAAPTPVVKTDRPAPRESEKRIPVTISKSTVKGNKPYLVERIVPIEIKRETPAGAPFRRPERLTVLRHVWEH